MNNRIDPVAATTIALTQLLVSVPDNIMLAARAAAAHAAAKRELAAQELALLATAGDAINAPNAEGREIKRRAYLLDKPAYTQAQSALAEAEEAANYTAATVEADRAELRIYEMLVKLLALPAPKPPKQNAKPKAQPEASAQTAEVQA